MAPSRGSGSWGGMSTGDPGNPAQSCPAPRAGIVCLTQRPGAASPSLQTHSQLCFWNVEDVSYSLKKGGLPHTAWEAPHPETGTWLAGLGPGGLLTGHSSEAAHLAEGCPGRISGWKVGRGSSCHPLPPCTCLLLAIKAFLSLRWARAVLPEVTLTWCCPSS